MEVISKKVITLSEYEVKRIISDYFNTNGFKTDKNNVNFIISEDESKKPYIQECTIDADIKSEGLHNVI